MTDDRVCRNKREICLTGYPYAIGRHKKTIKKDRPETKGTFLGFVCGLMSINISLPRPFAFCAMLNVECYPFVGGVRH